MIKFIFSLLISFFLLCFVLPVNSFASTTFTENFDSNQEGNFPKGWHIANDNTSNPCNATWNVHNGMAGINISNQGFCTTNIVPDDSIWNNLGNNYILELDIKFVRGTDHNIAFRFTESITNNKFYEVHFQSPGDFVLGGISAGNYNTYIGRSYPNGQTYHLKITVNKNNISVEIDGNLVRDFTSNIDILPSGRIALRAGTGADRNSETYFDNIQVTSIDSSHLPVPYYSQNDLPWGPSEYDHATAAGVLPPTMDRWGCAVSSAAMVMNYHGMTTMENGTKLDPDSLNNWLKTNDGYLTGVNSEGPYAIISWPAIDKLSLDLFNAGKSSVKLMHQRYYPSATTTAQLKDDLTVQNIPNIFQVKNASTSGHFVVATGLTANGYTINDPEWNVPDTSSFGDSFLQVDRFVPSHTNLSYIVIVNSLGTDFVVTDANGNKTGKEVINGQLQTFNQIPTATYALENSISNPDSNGNPQQLGNAVNIFLLPVPQDGNYTIKVSSQTNNDYSMNIQAYTSIGNSQVFTVNDTVDINQNDDIKLSYFQQLPATISRISRVVTADDLIKDLQEVKRIESLKDNSLFKQFMRVAQSIKENLDRGRNNRALKDLQYFENKLNKIRPIKKQLKESAYQLLLYDITYLKAHTPPIIETERGE